MVAEARWLPGTPLGLLIADDDPGFRGTLRTVFEPEGFRTYEAASGEEAIEIARVEPVHVLLMDWQMPLMSGLEAFRVIKSILGLVPCVFMTGRPTKEFMLRALAEKAFTVIEKPVSAGVVRLTVRRIVETYYT